MIQTTESQQLGLHKKLQQSFSYDPEHQSNVSPSKEPMILNATMTEANRRKTELPYSNNLSHSKMDEGRVSGGNLSNSVKKYQSLEHEVQVCASGGDLTAGMKKYHERKKMSNNADIEYSLKEDIFPVGASAERVKVKRLSVSTAKGGMVK